MDETSRKSLITAIEIIILLVILYIVAECITGYLDSLEAELLTTVINTPALLI